MLSVIEICCCHLYEEEDGKDEVDYRKDNVIDNVFDLTTGFYPSILDSTCNVACSGRKSRYAHHTGEYRDNEHDQGNFLKVEFHW